MPQALTIAVIGAGVGGLTAATLLAREGHRVTVIERFSTPAPVGSGLVIQPVGQEILSELDLLPEATALGARIDRMAGHDADTGRLVLDARYDRNHAEAFGLAIHRASLFSLLHDAAIAAGADFLTASEVTALTPAPSRHVSLADGRQTGPFDLVIDASGGSSPLRPAFAQPLVYGAIWGNVAWDPALPFRPTELRQVYRGAHHMLGILPIGHLPEDPTPLAAIFWSLPQAAFPTWRAAPLEAWKAEAAALWPDFARCLDQITSHDQMVMARYSHGTIASPIARDLAHIGDAAHMASPQLGQGANMALLDAAALARAIAHAPTVEQALTLYARSRRWHVRLYQALSGIFTPMYQSDSRLLPRLRDRVLMPVSTIPPMPRLLSAIVGGTLVQPFAGLQTKTARENPGR